MANLRLSDHALIRFLDRAAQLDVERIRSDLVASLERASEAAASIGVTDYLVTQGGITFIVRGGTVTTILVDASEKSRARALTRVKKP